MSKIVTLIIRDDAESGNPSSFNQASSDQYQRFDYGIKEKNTCLYRRLTFYVYIYVHLAVLIPDPQFIQWLINEFEYPIKSRC